MIKNDIGFVLPSLKNEEQSQLMCVLIKLLIDHNPKTQFCIFNQHSDLVDTYKVPLLPMSHARYFNGDLFIFDFPSLVISINFPTIKNIYYFTNATPWSTSYNEYESWVNIFSRNNLKVITNKEDIGEIYGMMWNNKLSVIKELNYETVLSIL